MHNGTRGTELVEGLELAQVLLERAKGVAKVGSTLPCCLSEMSGMKGSRTSSITLVNNTSVQE